MSIRPQNETLIVGLDRLGQEDAPRVGTKAANLGELLRGGFDVPPGIVTVGALDAEDEVVQEAVRAAAQLGDGPLAVRSSIAAEDLPGASFAGQYESVLGVDGPDALAAAVRHVRGSVRADRVQRYQDELAGGAMGAVGVVVQRQVAANAAGVAFTVNPVTGADEVVVSSVHGLGEALVSGETNPDEWVVRGDDVTCVRSPEDSLTDDQVREVAAAARRVADHFGFPVDVEWAFDAERLWLLQARSVTALPVAAEPVPVPVEVPDGFWEREASHFPEPIAPMSRMMLRSFTRGLTEAFAWAGMPMDGVEFRDIGGWTYMRVVPLGGKEPPRVPAPLAPAANALAARLHPLLRRRVARLEEVEQSDAEAQLVDRWWNEDRGRFIARFRALRDMVLPTLSDAEIQDHFDEVARLCADGSMLHHLLHLADVGFPIRLALFCQQHLGWPVQEVLAMLAGLSETSTEPARALAELAAQAAERPAVRELLEQPATDALAHMEEADPAFAGSFHDYLREFGCRALRYDAAEPSLAECPEVALGLLRDQLVRGYDAEARAAAHRDHRDAVVARARAELADGPSGLRDRFEWLLERAERAYPVREDNEFYLVSAPLALLRYAALEIGRRLVERGQLDRPEQVFFLEVDEVAAPLRGDDVRELVERREGEAAWVRTNPGPASYGDEPPEPVLAGFSPIVQERLKSITTAVDLVFEPARSGREQDVVDGGLEGIAASPGTYTGRVRVILDESEFTKIRAGDVLVCPITSPVWSVLFASVGALVTDTGGVLSHAAIIAREYRIPGVVATGNATQLLADGQLVTVDGSAGVVRLMEPSAAPQRDGPPDAQEP
jgi:rifampicin phosphotransferase